MKKILTSLFFLIFICSNCFCGDLERKFEQILSTQKEYELKKIKNDPYKMMRFPYDLTDQKIREMSATKVVSTKKVILSSFDKDFYYIAWYYVYNPKVIIVICMNYLITNYWSKVPFGYKKSNSIPTSPIIFLI